jgi:hypothetical protein
MPKSKSNINNNNKTCQSLKKARDQWWLFHTEEIKVLVYLQAAIFETSRLYRVISMDFKEVHRLMPFNFKVKSHKII